MLSVPSFAKINLSLEVLGRRADGYHELRTIFQTLALHDTLTFTPGRGRFAISCSDAEVPSDERNLVWKAARALWGGAGRPGEPHGIAVRLDKRIPAEAGLGGGSSNAAAALLALNRLWKLRMPLPRLLEVAATLGADVPFFLLGGTALGLGRGELLYPLPDVPPQAVVLVKPPFGVSTAEAYGWLAEEMVAGDSPRMIPRGDSPRTIPRGDSPRTIPRGDSPREHGQLPVGWFPGAIDVQNALEPAVAAHHPEVGRIREALLQAGARAARLCGSGSTVFGLFDDARRARAAADRLAWPRHLVAVTRTLGRTGFARRLGPVGLPVRRPIV